MLQPVRVKYIFGMDKMFCGVNAADRSASSEELESVIKHLETNLLKFGIRYPRLYPVSSLFALEGKLHANNELISCSGIHKFEADFVKFTFQELANIIIQSANHDLKRAMATLEQWINGAAAGEAVRLDNSRRLTAAINSIMTRLSEVSSGTEEHSIAQEINELSYYIKQRAGFRFGDHFNLAFNP